MQEQEAFEAVERAEKARRELPETEAAINTLRADYTAQWAAQADPQARERLWLAVKVLEEVRKHIIKVIENGKLAARDIAELEKAGQPARRRLWPV